MKVKHWILFLVGTCLIISLPVSILLNASKILTWPDLSRVGQIGDIFGGSTAPFINVVAALLIYLSFQKQIEANKLQREALDNEIRQNRDREEYQLLDKMLDEIKENIENLNFISPFTNTESKKVVISGNKSIGEFYKMLSFVIKGEQYDEFNFDSNLHRSVDKIIYLFNDIALVAEELRRSRVSEHYKNYLYRKLYKYFSEEIAFSLHGIKTLTSNKSATQHKKMVEIRDVSINLSQRMEYFPTYMKQYFNEVLGGQQ